MARAESHFPWKDGESELAGEATRSRCGLLQMASRADSSGVYPVLNCAGYVNHTGGLDGKLVDLVGFVCMISDWADGTKEPSPSSDCSPTHTRATRSVISIPSLRTRFSLAKTLAYGLYMYQLHCRKWVHRTLASQNVIFF
ncbi:hypothetical protein CSOJ01_04549 [Colletotrichum sojae]|uniref:Protein kinase domain-containing protein n=1 Tax=Colletotrichum sojae TaxID=2175907 RepID=A0A8H6MYC1_9PEZI|nr:hypothetical protein CSOJ01_04549 [Colletotrichum sojae]